MLKWPPDFDAVKFNKSSVQCRVKDTEIWIEFDCPLPEWLETLLPKEALTTITSWLDHMKK